MYDRLEEAAPIDAKTRLKWIALQKSDRFLPQPYTQLAKVLKEMGHEVDARRVLIARAKDRARVNAMSLHRRVWHHFLGVTIGYGYRPEQALLWILGFIVVGSVVFNHGFANGRFPESKDGLRPQFNALVYSVDTFVPLVDLHQGKYRLPTGPVLRVYLWLHVLCGWLLTTLLAVSLTGLVRR